MKRNWIATAALFGSVALLNGCQYMPLRAAHTQNVGQAIQQSLEQNKALQTTWQSHQPHQGSVAELYTWWQQFEEASLQELIKAANQNSPTVASAYSRMVEANALSEVQTNHGLPTLGLTGSASRGKSQYTFPITTSAQLGLQTQWELDLFGKQAARTEAAKARAYAATLDWHDARVSIAAQVAQLYFNLKQCGREQRYLLASSASFTESSRLTQLLVKQSIAQEDVLSQIRIHTLEQQSSMRNLKQQCDALQLSLGALTGLPIDQIKTLTPFANTLTVRPMLAPAITPIPAEALLQRPDVHRSFAMVEAARQDIVAAKRDRYPSIGLSGFIGKGFAHIYGDNHSFNTGTIGPLSVSLPIFDAGQRKANVNIAEVKYQEMTSQFNATARNAVKEVETLLQEGASLKDRLDAAHAVMYEQDAMLKRAQQRYKVGIDSLLDVERVHRDQINAAQQVSRLEHEQLQNFIQLYRAVGGSWVKPMPLTSSKTQ